MSKIFANTKLLLASIALVAFVNCLTFIFVLKYRMPLDADGRYYDAIGWNFAQGFGLIDGGKPFILKTPTYPLFLGLLYSVFGHSPILILIVQSILFSASCIILYYIARSVCDEKVSLLASIGLALYFPVAYYASGVLTEILSVFLTVLVVLFWMRYVQASRKVDLALCGILLGLDILCKPIMLLFPIVIALHVLWVKIKKTGLVKDLLVFFVVLSLTLAPWVVRNYLVFHEFILLSKDNFQSLLLVSVLEHRSSLWDWDMWGSRPNDPRLQELEVIRNKIRAEIKDQPSRHEEDYFLPEALKVIRDDPVRYVQASLIRALRLWISYPTQSSVPVKLAVIGFDVTLLILAFVGIAFSRARWKQLSVFWLPIVYITLLQMPLHVEPRYSAPMKPYLMIFISIGVVELVQRIRRWLSARGQERRTAYASQSLERSSSNKKEFPQR